MVQASTPDTSFFQAAVENSYDVVELLREDGTILYISPSVTRVIGFDPQQLIGTNAFDLVHPQDRARLQQELADALAQGQRGGEVSAYRCRDSNGDWHWVKATGSVLDSQAQPRTIIINARDITEQEENRQALLKVNREMNAIWENMSDAFVAVDNQWNITHLNSAVANLVQQPQTELVGRSLWEVFPRAVDSPFFRHYQHAVQEQVDVTFEEFSSTLNMWFEVHAYPSAVGLAIYFRNITNRKQAEESLRESEERFRRIFEDGPLGIAVVAPDGSLSRANARLCHMLGYSEQELRSLTIPAVTHPDDIEADVHLAQQLIAGEIPSYQLEKRYITKDGRVVWGSLTGALIRNEEGIPLYGLGIVEDITERKQVQELRTRLAAIVEFSDDAISSLDVHGVITSWNKGAERLHGYSEAEAVGQPISILAPPHHPQEVLAILEKLQRGESIRNMETQRRRKDGNLADISLTISPMFDASGQLVGSSAIARDISDRKQAEEDLRHSEKLYHTLAQHFPNGSVYLLDRNARVLVAEGRGLSSIGLSTEKMLGKTPREIFADQELCEKLERAHQRALDGDESVFETQLQGHYRLVHLVPVRDERDEISVVLAMTQDITAHKHAEAQQAQLNVELELQRRRLDDILAHVPGIVWESSIKPETLEQKVNYVSNYVEQMLGYTQEEWTNSADLWMHALHPEDREKVLAQSTRILWEGGAGVLQYRFVTNGGRVLWTETHCAVIRDEQNTVVGMRGVTMDITERMQAQEGQSRLAALLESTTDFVGWADANGLVQYINPAGRALLGIGQDEPIEGKSISEFSPPWAYKKLRDIAYPTAAREGSWAGEAAFLSRDGREIPVSRVLTAHKDADGNVNFYSTIARDISESKKIQAMLTQANEELESRVAQRTAELDKINKELQVEVIEKQMAVGALRNVVEMLERARADAEAAKEEAEKANQAKSEFLSRMSHELRTPLNAILGFGQILEMQSAEGAVQAREVQQQQEYIQLILKGGHHLLGLIDEVLDISRVETGHMELFLEPLALNEVVSEVCALVQPLAAQRRVRLDTNGVALKGNSVLADHQRLKQVLLNLLSNAIKYNREGGLVVVSCEPRPNNYLAITVRDTGLGIAPHDLLKLFTPFERLGAANSPIEGTGLGLALSQRLVTAMDGTLEVESVLGRGTTFTINVPQSTSTVQHGPDSPGEAVPLEANQDARRTSSVLCIEDNPSNLRLIKAILQRRPEITLLPAIQGSVGLELARQHAPDLILLDSQLPDISGQEVLHALQQSDVTRHIPVIIISADATERQIQQFIEAGAKAYLTKPFNITKFVRLLDETLQT